MAIDVSITSSYVDDNYYGAVGKGGDLYVYNQGGASAPVINNYIANTGGISPWTNRSYPAWGTNAEVSAYYTTMYGWNDTSLYDGRFYYRSDEYNYGSAVIEYLADGSIYEAIDPYHGMSQIVKRVNPSDNYSGVYLGAASYRNPRSPRVTSSWAELYMNAKDSSVETQYSSIKLQTYRNADANYIEITNDAINIGDLTRTDTSTYVWNDLYLNAELSMQGFEGKSTTFTADGHSLTFLNGILISYT